MRWSDDRASFGVAALLQLPVGQRVQRRGGLLRCQSRLFEQFVDRCRRRG